MQTAYSRRAISALLDIALERIPSSSSSSPSTSSSLDVSKGGWKAVVNPEAVLVAVSLLSLVPIRLQIETLSVLYELISPVRGLYRNKEVLCSVNLMELCLNSFGPFISGESQTLKDPTVSDDPHTFPSPSSSPLSPSTLSELISGTPAERKRLLSLCLAVIEQLGSFRMSPVELRGLLNTLPSTETTITMRGNSPASGDNDNGEAVEGDTAEVKKSEEDEKKGDEVSVNVSLHSSLLRMVGGPKTGNFVEMEMHSTGHASVECDSIHLSPSWDASQGFSISLWFNVQNFGYYEDQQFSSSNEHYSLVRLAHIGGATEQHNIATVVVRDCVLEVALRGSLSTPNRYLRYDTLPIRAGVWYHVMLCVRDDFCSMYVNGSAVDASQTFARKTPTPWLTQRFATGGVAFPSSTRAGSGSGSGSGSRSGSHSHSTPSPLPETVEKESNNMNTESERKEEPDHSATNTTQQQPTGSRDVNLTFGTPVEYAAPSSQIWWLGPVFLLQGTKYLCQISAIYDHGPSYIGSFQSESLEDIDTPSVEGDERVGSLKHSGSRSRLSDVGPVLARRSLFDPATIVFSMHAHHHWKSPSLSPDCIRTHMSVGVHSRKARLESRLSRSIASISTNNDISTSDLNIDSSGGGVTSDSKHTPHRRFGSSSSPHGINRRGSATSVVSLSEYRDDLTNWVVERSCALHPGVVLPNSSSMSEGVDDQIALPCGILSGGATCIKHSSVSDSIRMAGGLRHLLVFVEQADTPEKLVEALVLVAGFVHENPKNLGEMVRLEGYDIIAHVLKRSPQLITRVALGVLFCIVEGTSAVSWIKRETAACDIVQESKLADLNESQSMDSIPSGAGSSFSLAGESTSTAPPHLPTSCYTPTEVDILQRLSVQLSGTPSADLLRRHHRPSSSTSNVSATSFMSESDQNELAEDVAVEVVYHMERKDTSLQIRSRRKSFSKFIGTGTAFHNNNSGSGQDGDAPFSPRASSPTRPKWSLLANSVALKVLILDFHIWLKTSTSLQEELLQRLVQMCRLSPSITDVEGDLMTDMGIGDESLSSSESEHDEKVLNMRRAAATSQAAASNAKLRNVNEALLKKKKKRHGGAGSASGSQQTQQQTGGGGPNVCGSSPPIPSTSRSQHLNESMPGSTASSSSPPRKVSSSPPEDTRSWNAARLRQIGVVHDVLHIVTSVDSLPSCIINPLLELMELVLLQSFQVSDLRLFASYLAMGLDSTDSSAPKSMELHLSFSHHDGSSSSSPMALPASYDRSKTKTSFMDRLRAQHRRTGFLLVRDASASPTPRSSRSDYSTTPGGGSGVGGGGLDTTPRSSPKPGGSVLYEDNTLSPTFGTNSGRGGNSSTRSAAPISGGDVTVAAKILQVMVSTVLQCQDGPRTPHKRLLLTAFSDIITSDWVAMFLWPDVHPTIVGLVMKLLNAMLAVCPTFPKSFCKPRASKEKEDQRNKPSSSSSSTSSSSFSTTSMSALGSYGSFAEPTPVECPVGFDMLTSHVPKVVGTWDVYTALLGMLLGDVSQTAMEHTRLPLFDVMMLSQDFIPSSSSIVVKKDRKISMKRKKKVSIAFPSVLPTLFSFIRNKAAASANRPSLSSSASPIPSSRDIYSSSSTPGGTGAGTGTGNGAGQGVMDMGTLSMLETHPSVVVVMDFLSLLVEECNEFIDVVYHSPSPQDSPPLLQSIIETMFLMYSTEKASSNNSATSTPEPSKRVVSPLPHLDIRRLATEDLTTNGAHLSARKGAVVHAICNFLCSLLYHSILRDSRQECIRKFVLLLETVPVLEPHLGVGGKVTDSYTLAVSGKQVSRDMVLSFHSQLFTSLIARLQDVLGKSIVLESPTLLQNVESVCGIMSERLERGRLEMLSDLDMGSPLYSLAESKVNNQNNTDELSRLEDEMDVTQDGTAMLKVVFFFLKCLRVASRVEASAAQGNSSPHSNTSSSSTSSASTTRGGTRTGVRAEEASLVSNRIRSSTHRLLLHALSVFQVGSDIQSILLDQIASHDMLLFGIGSVQKHFVMVFCHHLYGFLASGDTTLVNASLPVWKSLVSHQLPILKEFLIHQSIRNSGKVYNLLDAGFSRLLDSYDSFSRWYAEHEDEVSDVFQETAFPYWRDYHQNETRSRHEHRQQFSQRQQRLLLLKNKDNAVEAHQHMVLEQARRTHAYEYQELERTRQDRRRQEDIYHETRISGTLREILFGLAHENLMYAASTSLYRLPAHLGSSSFSERTPTTTTGTTSTPSGIVVSGGVGYATGLSHFLSIAASRSISSFSQSSRLPEVATMWLADRWMLDFTEGPSRQRKKLTNHTSFMKVFNLRPEQLMLLSDPQRLLAEGLDVVAENKAIEEVEDTDGSAEDLLSLDMGLSPESLARRLSHQLAGVHSEQAAGDGVLTDALQARKRSMAVMMRVMQARSDLAKKAGMSRHRASSSIDASCTPIMLQDEDDEEEEQENQAVEDEKEEEKTRAGNDGKKSPVENEEEEEEEEERGRELESDDDFDVEELEEILDTLSLSTASLSRRDINSDLPSDTSDLKAERVESLENLHIETDALSEEEEEEEDVEDKQREVVEEKKTPFSLKVPSSRPSPSSGNHTPLSLTPGRSDGGSDMRQVQGDVSGYERVLRLLEPGDEENIFGIYICARISGLDRHDGIAVVCKNNMYVMASFIINNNGEVEEIETGPDPVSFYAHMVPIPTDNGSLDVSLNILPLDKKGSGTGGGGSSSMTPAGGNGSNDASSDRNRAPQAYKIVLDEVVDMYKRKYQLQDVGMEIFNTNGWNSLLVFEEESDRDEVYNHITSKMTAHSNAPRGAAVSDPRMQVKERGGSFQKAVMKRWINCEISNFTYLMYLNTCAGRSFNDLTQYPVFPWILSSYDGDRLDLSNPSSYRDLTKPMGALGQRRAEQFQVRYESWDDPSGVVPQFHYGTHYSSAATVLYYLVRLEPFTRVALQLQGNKFDHADRMFFSMQHTWTSASTEGGLSDVKELIPEFFYLSEFLENRNHFALGSTQRGQPVHDVVLPPWALGDTRIFVARHRRALESMHVSGAIHNWIDLIFGYKQRGKAAEDAQNVFYYLTYDGAIDMKTITDPMTRISTIAQINNFGQTPQQLFTKPHPARKVPLETFKVSVNPLLLGPKLVRDIGPHAISDLSFDVTSQKLMYVHEERAFLGSAVSSGLYIRWGLADSSLRVCGLAHLSRAKGYLNHFQDEAMSVIDELHDGQISTAVSSKDGRLIFTGGEDGVVKVWGVAQRRKKSARVIAKVGDDVQLRLNASLWSHADEISAIAVSNAWSIIVSGSQDGDVIVWDMNRLELIRHLPLHPASVSCITINEDNGDIVTACGTNVFVWSLNGEVSAHLHTSGVTSVCCVPRGERSSSLDDTVLITGHADGKVRFWSLSIPSTLKDLHRVQNTFFATCGFIGGPSSAPSATISNDGDGEGSSASNRRRRKPKTETASGEGENGAEVKKDEEDNDDKSPTFHPNTPYAPSIRPPYMEIVALQKSHQEEKLTHAHSSAVTCIHVPVGDPSRMWTGDEEGHIYAWSVREQLWAKELEHRACHDCSREFSVYERRQRCRNCDEYVCKRCATRRSVVRSKGYHRQVPVCERCYLSLK